MDLTRDIAEDRREFPIRFFGRQTRYLQLDPLPKIDENFQLHPFSDRHENFQLDPLPRIVENFQLDLWSTDTRISS